MMQIPDPVHGYIPLEGMYADIVNTPEFQRLRSIEQVSFRPSYPGARHDRFIHSLGTYYLAGKFVDSFFRNLKGDAGITVPENEARALKATFLYAALLHDIGHAPFSHTTEDFFLLPKDPVSGLPQIWEDLCSAVSAVNPAEGALFRKEDEEVGAAHEIVSALVLVSKWDTLTNPKRKREPVDLALAARMVIGLPYKNGDLRALSGSFTTESLGIRNCLIRMLNYSTLDVDRLDYMGRDSSLTGFLNAPLDLECLAASVTAVREDGWLVPAYRDDALRVFDLMFQAKLSHDAWVIGSPASVYEAELLKHCIRGLNKEICADYMDTIFTPKALSREGVDLSNRKHYRLLSDMDISVDLKAQSGGLYDELYTRQFGSRRTAAWRSFYEYRHIFNAPEEGMTPDAVYQYFKPLLDHMKEQDILVFNENSYNAIPRVKDSLVTHAADFLRDYLMDLGEENPGKKTGYSAVLLGQTHNLTISKIDPRQVRIVFPKLKKFLRTNGENYSTYYDLTRVAKEDNRKMGFFLLFRHGGLGHDQLTNLQEKLSAALMDARALGILIEEKEDKK